MTAEEILHLLSGQWGHLTNRESSHERACGQDTEGMWGAAHISGPWFGRDNDIVWFNRGEEEQIIKYIDSQFGESDINS